MIKTFRTCSLLLLAVTATALAQESNGLSLGLRAGYSSPESSRPLVQAEVFSIWNFPKALPLGASFSLRPRLELTAGHLSGHDENGFVGTLGPELVLRHAKWPVTLDGGIRPTVLSRDHFGTIDYGIPFQFTSHIGLDWEVTRHWKLGYRFQHMSNAGFASPNPGLNLHLFSTAYQF